VTSLKKKNIEPVRSRNPRQHTPDKTRTNLLSPERKANKTFEEDRDEESKNHMSIVSLGLSNKKHTILSNNSITKKSHAKMMHDSNFKDTQGLFTDESESIQHDEDESMGRQNPNPNH